MMSNKDYYYYKENTYPIKKLSRSNLKMAGFYGIFYSKLLVFSIILSVKEILI